MNELRYGSKTAIIGWEWTVFRSASLCLAKKKTIIMISFLNKVFYLIESFADAVCFLLFHLVFVSFAVEFFCSKERVSDDLQ